MQRVAHVIIYCVSPSPKNWVYWFLRLGLEPVLLGQGIGDLDSGLTIENLYLQPFWL